jgi:hypothetical protein
VTRFVLGYGINEAWKKTIASSIRAAIAETLWTETSRRRFPFHPNFRIQQLSFEHFEHMTSPQEHDIAGGHMSQPRRNVTRLVLGYGINAAWQKTMHGRTIAETLWTETFPFDHPNFRIQQLSFDLDRYELDRYGHMTSPQEVT